MDTGAHASSSTERATVSIPTTMPTLGPAAMSVRTPPPSEQKRFGQTTAAEVTTILHGSVDTATATNRLETAGVSETPPRADVKSTSEPRCAHCSAPLITADSVFSHRCGHRLDSMQPVLSFPPMRLAEGRSAGDQSQNTPTKGGVADADHPTPSDIVTACAVQAARQSKVSNSPVNGEVKVPPGQKVQLMEVQQPDVRPREARPEVYHPGSHEPKLSSGLGFISSRSQAGLAKAYSVLGRWIVRNHHASMLIGFLILISGIPGTFFLKGHAHFLWMRVDSAACRASRARCRSLSVAEAPYCEALAAALALRSLVLPAL